MILAIAIISLIGFLLTILTTRGGILYAVISIIAWWTICRWLSIVLIVLATVVFVIYLLVDDEK
jgi:hypothetical protein